MEANQSLIKVKGGRISLYAFAEYFGASFKIVSNIYPKKKILGAKCSWANDPKYYTALRVFKEQCHGWYFCTNDGSRCVLDDNENVPVLYRNDNKRELNLNNCQNKWNNNCRFAAVRNSLLFPAKSGFLFTYNVLSPTTEHFTNFIKLF